MYRMHAVSNHPSTRVARNSLCTLTIALLMLAAATLPPSARSTESTLPRFVTEQSKTIDCNGTPFGRRAILGQESEMLELISSTGDLNNIGELQYSLDGNAFWRDFSDDLVQYPLVENEVTFVDATALDLNGDGQEELVVAYRDDATGWLQLGVFRRSEWPGGDTYATLWDVWTLEQTFDKVVLASGDLNGSADNREELAVVLKGDSGSLDSVDVFVLKGDGDGNIAAIDGTSDAHFAWTLPQLTNLSMATGDLLLDGHDQIAISAIADIGGSYPLQMLHLLAEYQPTTDGLYTPSGSTIGYRVDYTPIGHTFRLTEGDVEGVGFDYITRMDTLVGDVAGDVAAELVDVVQFQQSDDSYIGLRLQHYAVTRDDDNVIIAIELAQRDPNDAGSRLDSGILVQEGLPAGSASFEAAIADVDRLSPSEIVIARGVPGDPKLLVSAYKAIPDFEAGFTFEIDGQHAVFTNTSTGESGLTFEWDFGDETGHAYTLNATHDYQGTGPYRVTLAATNLGGTGETREVFYDVSTGNDSGGEPVPSFFRLRDTPTYEGEHLLFEPPQFVNVAVSDMNMDGVAEIMTEAKASSDQLLRSVWWLADPSDSSSFELSSKHQTETSPNFVSITAIDNVPADFDGDSLTAILGTLDTDCRLVHEPQLRQVVWLPPYFERLQGDVEKEASFGQSTETGSDTEHSAGSYTSHDISGYVGLGVGLDFIGAKVQAKATAGYHYQAAHGAIRGNGNSFEVNQGASQNENGALVIVEENSFNCYSYDVGTAADGILPLSGVRMCKVVDDTRHISASDAVDWDTRVPADTPGHPPAQWAPLQRDWNSEALFKQVTSNVAFVDGSGQNNATDGMFSTEAKSQGITSQPYLQIDLGKVRDISNIRVFPTTDQSAMLTGFRLYASPTPMTGPQLPSGAAVTSFTPATEDGAVLDRWNVWTRERNPPYQMLRARYIRLQHPSDAQLRIAEIQVFGAVHAEPPAYPDAVCDPVAGDGYFYAWVWDNNTGEFRKIEQRGDLLWDGTYDDVSGQINPPNGEDCDNFDEFTTHAPIWTSLMIGTSGLNSWSLGESNTDMVGDTTSFERAIHVGAEFDLETGFIATVQTGLSEDFATGLTSDTQTTSYWTTGLETGGTMDGFEDSSLIDECKYNPRPYAYHLVERSITGYQHDIYVVDYIVRQSAAGNNGWQRGSVPILCSRPDPIFASGFE